jgi:hypothetical protein
MGSSLTETATDMLTQTEMTLTIYFAISSLGGGLVVA